MNPDFIVADSGSDDIGPVLLGSDTSCSPLEGQTQDLERMLLASRSLGVPMIIGSAGDTGANSRVDLYVGIIKDLAVKHKLSGFKLGYFYSEVEQDLLREKLRQGEAIEGLHGRAELTLQDIEATDRVVALAGVHPYMKLLDLGADVIIGGRGSDNAIFAAPAIRAGFPESFSYYLGKVLECASFCAEPYGGKESVVGEISMQDVKVTAMHPEQRCTVASVAGHAMYERADPYYEHVAGGVLDMRQCRYEQYDEKTTRVTGPEFRPATEFRVKLEGSGKVGERYVGIVGIRDPDTIANVDKMIEWCRAHVREKFGDEGYQLFFHVYGRDAVMGNLEPCKTRSHEVCLVIQAIAPTKEMAEEVCGIATRQTFYARIPESKGTAGMVAVLGLNEVLPGKPAYRWTMSHTLRIDDPLELFPVHMTEAGEQGSRHAE